MLAGSVTLTSIILLAVHPETLHEDVLKVFPYDTVLAVPDSGLDPSRVNYVIYRYYGVNQQQSTSETDRLSLYRELCNNLKRLTRTVDSNHSFTLPEEVDVSIVEVDHQYLLEGSNIVYQINLTLSPPETTPPYCYAKVDLRGEQFGVEGVDICNSTTATFSVSASRNAYAFVDLLIFGVHLHTIDIQASGTVHYYDINQSQDPPECQIDPPSYTSCLIPINNINNIGSPNICILAVRESTATNEFSEFEYDIASFAVGQAILLTLTCVGLVSFVCMCGLATLCHTKQGKRLRVALRMSSPLH